MSAIPRISIDQLSSKNISDSRKASLKLGQAIADCGFAIISDCNHISGLLAKTYSVTKDFFDLPIESKLQCKKGGGERGYYSFGAETAKNSSFFDLKEYFHIGPEKHEFNHYELPKNYWPDALPLFRETLLAFYSSQLELAKSVLKALEQHLGLNSGILVSLIDGGNSVLRLLHYPALSQVQKNSNHIRAAAHEDINLITLLAHTEQAGLEILHKSTRKWIPVVTKENDIIIDTGDMMTLLTNSFYPATTHRVVNTDASSQVSRYSIPFFVHPRPEVLLRCLSSCRSSLFAEKFVPITAEDYLQQRLQENGLREKK